MRVDVRGMAPGLPDNRPSEGKFRGGRDLGRVDVMG